MRFEHRTRYAASPDAVRAMLVDPDFRRSVCERVHSTAYDVTVAEVGSDTQVTVVQEQAVRKVPAVATKVVGDSVQIKQVETWGPTSASLELTIPGKPGSLSGTSTLTARGEDTEHVVSGELKVGIPLVGGKLEKLIADILVMFYEREAKLGQTYLAGS